MTAQAGDTALFKTALRRKLRAQRASIPAARRALAAQQAADKAWRLPALRKARRVALYLASGSELDAGPLLKKMLRRGVQVFLPRLRWDGMHWRVITASTALRRNAHGIREPVHGVRCRSGQLDVIILPLVGFDSRGTRLGAGGGHYDRALAARKSRRRPLRIGYAYAQQHCEPLPRELWDVPLHAVITERGLWQWRTG